jgi:hypothetical protein
LLFGLLLCTAQACEHLPENDEPAVTERELTDEDWMNEVRESIADSVYQSAFWFDSFFAEQGCQQRKPQTSARISLSWRPKTENLSEFKTRFRVKVKLPHFQDRADLILSDDAEEELDQLPLESLNKQSLSNKEESFSAAIRFIHKNETNKFTDSRLGIAGGDIFVRARHQRLFSWQNKHGVKIEPALYYFVKDGLGAKLLLEYNYQLAEQKQLRFDYSVRASESYTGLRWKHGLYRLAQLGEDKASALGLTLEGERNGENGYFVDKYTVSYRYRFNALRQWLFFEIEPFVEWQRENDFNGATGLALKIEGYFAKH